MPKRFFFATYGGGHVVMCIPVIRELQRRGHETVTLALTTAGEVMKRQGMPHKRVINYVDPKSVESYGKRLLAKHHTDGKGISVEESMAYLGVSLQNLAEEIGEEDAWKRYEEKGLSAFRPVAFLKKILQQEKPDVVIATVSPRMEIAALQAARELGIPSLRMVDLFGLDPLDHPNNGDAVTVYSEKIKRRLVKEGRRPEQIFVTGNPAFDTLAEYAHHDIAPAYKAKKNIAPEKKIILWAEQPEMRDPELPRRVRVHLHAICQKHGWQLLVRLHPSMDVTKEIIPKDAAQSLTQEPLHEAIAAANVVVTLTSTVGLEAVLLDKPALIIPMISQYHTDVDYSEEDGALVIKTLEEAEHGLKILLSDNAESQKLHHIRQSLPKVGDATGKVCDVLEKLA